MNKGLLIGAGVVAVAGIGFGIYKFINKKSEEPVEDVENIVEEVKENVKETSTEEYVDELLKEEAELEEYEEKERKSMTDMNVFEDKVSESSEFAAINAMREAAGKDPIEVNEKFEKFLGKDSEKTSMKESLDNIAEGIKKDPKLKKRILDILSE